MSLNLRRSGAKKKSKRNLTSDLRCSQSGQKYTSSRGGRFDRNNLFLALAQTLSRAEMNLETTACTF